MALILIVVGIVLMFLRGLGVAAAPAAGWAARVDLGWVGASITAIGALLL